MAILSAVLFTRSVFSNYIFDEQEALLANPYVNGKSLKFFDAIHRDFWGLPADRSVGSYRPLPNFVWRSIWTVQRTAIDLFNKLTHGSSPTVMQPWVFHWINVLLHAVNGAIVVCFVYSLSKRKGFAWVAGATFVASAVITEAVCGVVGIADVMGGMGALLALLALRMPMPAMGLSVFAAILFGLFSKESALVCVPLVPLAAIIFAPLTHPTKPRRWFRGIVSLVATVSAFVLYVQLRKHWFHSPDAPELSTPLPQGASLLARAARGFMVWFHQAPLPKDPLNNPLVDAPPVLRIAGALRVFFRGLVQVVFPHTLSGDYSFPQEPVPAHPYELESLLGGLALVGFPIAGVVLWIRSFLKEKTATPIETATPAHLLPPPVDLARLVGPFSALGLIWIVVSYFPHSNIPVLLPTVRAERFWYFPIIGSCFVIAAVVAWLYDRTKGKNHGAIAIGIFAAFLAYQGARCRLHAFDYKDDLVFWDATRHAVPRSAKAHLNYSVMWGARGRLDIRLESNRVAAHLAPKWPMAHVYLGDTLCRLHRAPEAWPHYAKGFEMANGDPNLISLGLQCMWEEQDFEPHREELIEIASKYPGSWLHYLVHDVASNGTKNNGVDPKYRPRGYNEGPKE
jgi:hypothetical protein